MTEVRSLLLYYTVLYLHDGGGCECGSVGRPAGCRPAAARTELAGRRGQSWRGQAVVDAVQGGEGVLEGVAQGGEGAVLHFEEGEGGPGGRIAAGRTSHPPPAGQESAGATVQ